MRKILVFIAVFAMIMCTALAEIDLSSMSYEELISLKEQLASEIISRPEWKEVTVPAGEWVIGKDIPAGAYSIIIPKGGSSVIHLWGAAIEDFKTNGGLRISDYRKEGQDYGKIELYEGNVLQLSNPVILSIPMSLGF